MRLPTLLTKSPRCRSAHFSFNFPLTLSLCAVLVVTALLASFLGLPRFLFPTAAYMDPCFVDYVDSFAEIVEFGSF